MTSETIADIVAEMRKRDNLDEKSNDRIPRSLMGLGLRAYADRIETAAKRACSTQKSENCVEGNAAAISAFALPKQLGW